jgi:WD40 repeat protein
MQTKNRINARRLINFSGHTGSIYALGINTKQNIVYSGAADGMVIAWSEAEPNQGRLIAKLTEPVYSLFYDEGSNYLWIGAASGNLHVIDLQNKAELKLLTTHTRGVFDIKKWGNSVIVAGGDGSISLYDSQSLAFERLITLSNKSIRCIAIHPGKGLMALGSSDFHIYVYDEDLHLVQPKIAAHSNSVFSLAFDLNGDFLLSGGRDAMLNFWDVKNGFSLINSVAAHNLHVHSIAFNPVYNLFLTSSMDKTIKIWDAESFQLVRVMDKQRHQAHVNSINKIAWLSKDKFLSVSDDKNVMLWELDS